MPRKRTNNAASAKPATSEAVTTFRHQSKRKNIPAAGLEAQGVIKEAPRIRYEYNPHLPPVLRSAPNAAEIDQLPELLRTARQRTLTEEEAHELAAALRKHEPWLEWSGKREKPWFEVEPVALHIHERVSTQAILRVLAREDVQRDLFADPQQTYAQAVQFYQHDVDWANRMILGDSLQVMASFAHREDLAGKVQMIYIDPPYGIKFASNFQPQLGQRDVKDREQDLTREPEMVKAYRDTWTLGIHSYLAYLRDRLAMARELLADTGSIFVQISDENLHRVRCVMDEVFKAENFVAIIVVQKSGSTTTELISNPCDYVIWYAKEREKAKFNRLYIDKDFGSDRASKYTQAELSNGLRCPVSMLTEEGLKQTRIFRLDAITSQGLRQLTSVPFTFRGKQYNTGKEKNWKTSLEGMSRLERAERIEPSSESLNYVRFLNDFSVFELTSLWDDVGGIQSRSDPKIYVVQTPTKIIERCLLMTTDPGDLVLDPTCGSGTTAYVAEQWGRRWITTDTSRVALALAKQRLLTARFPYYKLRLLNAEDVAHNPHGTWLTDPMGELSGKCTFQCKTVPHITLKSIARNTSLDPIFAKHEPILAEKRKVLNAALKHVTTELRQRLIGKLAEKQKREGKKAITEADRRRWQLPKTEWQEWEVPFDTDPDWPQPLQDALLAYRQAWRAKMDEVNACIAANAETEELVDKPDEVKGIVRVSGPFTMEGVIALEEGLDTPIGGAPEEDLETFGDAGDIVVTNAEAHLDKILRLLKASGVDFPGNKPQQFARLEPITGASLLHAEGEWTNGDNTGRPDPKYFKLWEHITRDLRAGEKLSGGKPKPEVVYRKAEDALLTLAGEWKERFVQMQAATPSQERVPPVTIIVCDNTAIAEHFHHMTSGAFEIAREVVRALTEVGRTGKESLRRQSRRVLFPQVLRIVSEYIAHRVDLNGCHPSEIGLQTYTQRIVSLLAAAIAPDDEQGEAPLLPRLNRYKPIGSTAHVHFKTIKPVQATEASHLNFVACDTDSWEQAAVFQLEKLAKDGMAYCYARNDHLEFNIPYELYGMSHVYEPDFLVKLTTDVTVILEVKGQTHGDTATKHQAAQRWVKAVNHWGNLGEWDFLVCREPQRLSQNFHELNAVRKQKYLSSLTRLSPPPTG